MPNIALLEEHLAYLEAHPEQHDQRLWTNECGTAFCLAGLCALEVAKKNDWSIAASWRYSQFGKYGYFYTDEVSDTVKHAHAIAREEYGLSSEEAEALFHEDNSINDMKLMVKNLANAEDISEGLDDLPAIRYLLMEREHEGDFR